MYFNLDKDYLMKLYNTRIQRLKDYIMSNNLKSAVIGLSGGIDSALTSYMLKDAIGSENIYPVMLPSYESTEESQSDAKKVIEKLGIPEENVKIVEIGEITKLILNQCQFDENNIEPMIKGNISARVRMIILYAYANKLSYNGKRAFVEGTENESEYRTGYFTKYGDSGTDFEAMKGLYKTQVRAISRLIEVPEEIINKKPSAELVKDQTDEDELGITYEDIDNILFVLFEEKNTMRLSEFPKDKIMKLIGIIEKSSHKRNDTEEAHILNEAKQILKAT
ncbi:MAG: NAD(+) synthase [Spirochaetota bacterium]